MTINIDAGYAIGDKVRLFGFGDVVATITQLIVRADGSVEHCLEWYADGIRREWMDEGRLGLLAERVHDTQEGAGK